MVLYSFPYLLVSFFLAVWIARWYKYLIIFVIHFTFQGIYYGAGGTVDDPALFWGWQALVTFLGIVTGGFVSRKRSSLFSKHWVPWVHFLLSLAILVGMMFFYSAYPPLSTVPAGESSLGLTVALVIDVVAVLMLWGGFRKRNRFFGRWLVSMTLIHLFMYIAISGLAEVWTALIAGGGTILISAFVACFEKNKIKTVVV